MTVKFHKNGLMLMSDAGGTIHVFDPRESLKAVAQYVWTQDALKDLRVEGETMPEAPNLHFVELSPEKAQRLRNLTELTADDYYGG